MTNKNTAIVHNPSTSDEIFSTNPNIATVHANTSVNINLKRSFSELSSSIDIEGGTLSTAIDNSTQNVVVRSQDIKSGKERNLDTTKKVRTSKYVDTSQMKMTSFYSTYVCDPVYTSESFKYSKSSIPCVRTHDHNTEPAHRKTRAKDMEK